MGLHKYYNELLTELQKIYNKSHIKLKKGGKKKRKDKPWITPEIKLILQEKEADYKEFMKDPLNEDKKKTYHDKNMQANKALNRAKTQHDRNEMSKVTGNNRLMWRKINEKTGRKSKGSIDTAIIKNFKVKSKESIKKLTNEFATTFVQEYKYTICNTKL